MTERTSRDQELEDALALALAVGVIRRRAKKNRAGRISVLTEAICRSLERWAVRLREEAK